MLRNVFRPDLPKAHLDRLTCHIVLQMLPLDKVLQTYGPSLSPEQRQELREQWALMYTITKLARALDQPIHHEAPTTEGDTETEAVTAAEAGRLLGVGGKRVRQLAHDGVLERVDMPDNRVWVSRASVDAEAARRVTQKDRNAGRRRPAA